MNADRLLDLYEKVAEAPDAVPRLRRFMLDLAVRGKLVPQEASDEPASELLKRIAAEKVRLVKAGEIRKPRDLANGDELVPPFDIPATWRWCRLDTVGAIIGGGTPSAGDPENFAEPGEGIPWLTPADLGGYRELSIERGARDLTEKGLASSSATMMPAGTVLFTSRAPIGYVAIAANPISTNQGFKSIVPYVADCSRFIALAMQTFAPDIDSKAPGTTFKEVSGKIVAGVPFPLPPLAEQRRIVAKVEELMALLDRLEAARQQREATRDRLTAASLARLTAPNADAADFPANARFALATLPALTTRPDQIKPLRQAILNLAVRGKLVEQNPTDEPASELLKRIAAKRAELVKAGSAKREKPTIGEEFPFELPTSWSWCTLGKLCQLITKGSSPKWQGVSYVQQEDGLLFITSENVGNFTLRKLDDLKYVERRFKEVEPRSMIQKGDILINLVGASIGRTAIYTLPDEANINQAVSLVRLVDQTIGPSTDYLLMFLNSDAAVDLMLGSRVITAQPNISLANVNDFPIPLPPLAEQHRIVAKVDALMALCDRLEAALATTDTTRARLLEALLHEALGPAAEAVTEAAE